MRQASGPDGGDAHAHGGGRASGATLDCAADAAAATGTRVPEFAGGASPERVPRLRRRTAVLAALACAAAGSGAGLLCASPVYHAQALIGISPTIPRILYATDAQREMPMYEQFLESQAALACSRRVVDMAMASDAWRRTGRGGDADAIVGFQAGLFAAPRASELLLEIGFRDGDPAVAAASADAVVTAYMRLVAERESVAGSTTVRVLENRRTALLQWITDLLGVVSAASDGLGAGYVEARYRAAVDELTRIDRVLHASELEIAEARATESGKSGPAWTARVEALARRDDAVAVVRDLEKTRSRIAHCASEAESARALLAETKRRLDEIDIESHAAPRISVVAQAVVPAAPETDDRGLFALIGAAAGAALGGAAAWIASRRVRRPAG